MALGISLLAWSGAAMAGPPKPKNSQARKHFDAAVERYGAQDFDGAVEEARAGLEIEEHESLMFLLAQAERQRGNCEASVEVLDRFIAATDNEAMRDNALTARGLCEEVLAEQARLAEEQAAAEAAAAAAMAEPEPESPPPEPLRPWFRDPLGGALVGVGGASVLVGGGVLIAAAVLDPDDAQTYGDYDQRFDQQPRLLAAGAITASIGAAVGIAGAVRWTLLARRRELTGATQARVELRPWIERRRAGLWVSARF